MAATMSKARGIRKDGYPQSRLATRLGHGAAEGEANTWRTFTLCHVNKDGSGFVEVKRDGKVMHRFEFGPEPLSSGTAIA